MNSPSLTLDLRAVAPEERRSQTLAKFDALATGQSLLVQDHSAALDVLSEMQSSRKGLFEWSIVAAQAGLHEVQVTRRQAEAGSLRRVHEALAWDHDRLDALEQAAFRSRAGNALEEARHLFQKFAFGLERHIRFEEELLFPELEARTGMPSHAGPTAVMRLEHVQIRGLLATIAATIADPGSPAEDSRQQLLAILGQHNHKEEMILYPMVDRILTSVETDGLVARIQQNP